MNIKKKSEGDMNKKQTKTDGERKISTERYTCIKWEIERQRDRQSGKEKETEIEKDIYRNIERTKHRKKERDGYIHRDTEGKKERDRQRE